VVPLLNEYASDPEKVRKELDELAREAFIDATIPMLNKDPTWLRDATINIFKDTKTPTFITTVEYG